MARSVASLRLVLGFALLIPGIAAAQPDQTATVTIQHPGGAYTATKVVEVFAGGNRGEALSPEAETLAEILGELGYVSSMIGEQHQLAPRFGLSQRFDHYNHKGSKAESIHFGVLEWLADSERPFFTYLHYLELHWPYCPPETTRGRFTPGWEGREFCFQWRKLRNDLRSGAVVLSPQEIEVMSARYDEELLALDARGCTASSAWPNRLILRRSSSGHAPGDSTGRASRRSSPRRRRTHRRGCPTIRTTMVVMPTCPGRSTNASSRTSCPHRPSSARHRRSRSFEASFGSLGATTR